MGAKGRARLLSFVVVLTTVPLLPFAAIDSKATAPPRNAEGPPLRHTGGFGEPTCQECHSEYPINVSGGAVAIEGLPDRYEAGRTYRIGIILASEDMGRAGFEAAVRYMNGPHAGEQAGRVVRVDGRVSVTADRVTLVSFVHHSASGSLVENPSQVTWDFAWTAPDPSSPLDAVILHVAANSANSDNSPLGDLIYTSEVQSTHADSGR